MTKPLRPNSTQVPDEILDRWMADLSGAEFKVIMYIVRRTYGFQKDGDTISLRQIVGGIVKRDGTRLDSGTGLNKDTVCKSLASLEKRGFIYRESRKDETGDLPNYYSLNLELGGGNAPGPGSGNPTGEGGKKVYTRVAKSDRRAVGKTGQGGVGDSDSDQSLNPTLQQTALQKTDLQDTAATSELVAAVRLPSAEDKGVEILVGVGFTPEDAKTIAAGSSLDTIRRQVAWLPQRKVSDNRLGLLRRSIERDWQEPALPQHDGPPQNDRPLSRNGLEESQRKVAQRLKAFYSRLKLESSEVFQALTAFIEETREKERFKPLLRDNPKRLEAVLSSYELEEKRIEVMVDFFRGKEIPIPEFASLLQELKRTPFPAWEFFLPAA